MKSIGAKVTEQIYEALRDYCEQRKLSMNELLVGLIQDLLRGKVKFKGTGVLNTVPLCPECSFALFYHATKQDGPHLLCLRCGFWSKVKLPKVWHEGKIDIK